MSGFNSKVWHSLGGTLRYPSQVRKGMGSIILPRAELGTALMTQDQRHRMECEAYAKKVRVCYARQIRIV